MRFTWDDSAKRGLYQVAEYIKDNFGVKSLKKFRQELVHTTDFEEKNTIHIVAFWDCRCEPLTQIEYLE